MKKRRQVYRKSHPNNLVSTGVKNLVGVGMIGATAGMVNALPSGTAKDIAKVVPGLQATSLVVENTKAFNFKTKNKRRK